MLNLIKEIRELTGAGMGDVKEALQEAGGDKDKAIEILRKKGAMKMGKKSDRATKEGVVETYVHGGGRIGVMVEINCETDFVARTDDFKALARELALHIAAANPLYINVADVPGDVIEKEKEIYKEQAKESGKPEAVIEKMLEGKLQKYFEEVCLMEQPYVKNPDVKVKQFVTDAVAKMGENVVVRRFARFVLGN